MIHYGPFRRRTHTGVPADHFPPARNRFVAVDHRGRITALVAEGGTGCGCTHDGCTGGPDDIPDGADCDGCATCMAAAAAPEMASTEHEPFSGSHSHPHSAFGSQGDDSTHEHEHAHDNDAAHGHTHGAAADVGDALTDAAGRTEMTGERLAESLRAGASGSLSSPALDALTADTGPDMPQIVSDPGGAWHAYTHVEGIRTDDGREIMAGATQFPDLPVSLRYLKEDEGGHYGAEACGRIDTMEMQIVNGIVVCYATGVFGTDKAGQNAQLAVEEQTQRFISIDPRDVEGEYIEVQISTSGSIFDDCDSEYDGWFRMTSFVVGAATIVPIPALQQAVITMADVPLPMAPLATERAQSNVVITASGAPMVWPDNPPAEWFAVPVPTVGDPRLVRQPDGKYAVPLTVTDDGQIYGHACYWGQEHTGMPGQKVRPPRSATYAHYMTGERIVDTGAVDDDGAPILDRIAVGKLTMGTGHPGVHGVSATAAKAHYDGGYGAVQVADVRAVEDDFGIWLSGALCPVWSDANPGGPTPAQVSQFISLDLSPDWRKVAGKLHMIAVLAVPVGGFPVARESLVASGLSEEDDAAAARASFDGDEIVAMVAAGRVHRTPMHVRMGNLERLVDDLSADLTDRRRAAARDALAALTAP